MVAGLQERDQLRDLFGRHVGEEVVRRAVDANESVSGDEREVAILFIDLVGSTQLAATREPHEVAAVLNDFFRIVVAHVDKRNGLINKFQGDAALAVFGAPLRIDDPASAVLTTARALGAELRRLPSTSASGSRPAQFSPATSARKTVTSTRLSGTPSTRRHGWRTEPRTSTDGCCVPQRRSTAPTRRSDGAGACRARKCCAAGRNSHRSRRPCSDLGALAVARRRVAQRPLARPNRRDSYGCLLVTPPSTTR
jgi:hypothetical protein